VTSYHSGHSRRADEWTAPRREKTPEAENADEMVVNSPLIPLPREETGSDYAPSKARKPSTGRANRSRRRTHSKSLIVAPSAESSNEDSRILSTVTSR